MEKTKVGQVLEEESAELVSNAQKKADEINKAADILNTIKLPCNATFYSHGMAWSIRNVAFWESLKKREEEFMKLINVQAK